MKTTPKIVLPLNEMSQNLALKTNALIGNAENWKTLVATTII
jgi:hypothetical protein